MTDMTQRIEPLSAEDEAAFREDAEDDSGDTTPGAFRCRALLATLDRDREKRDRWEAEAREQFRLRSAANERIAVLEGALESWRRRAEYAESITTRICTCPRTPDGPRTANAPDCPIHVAHWEKEYRYPDRLTLPGGQS